MPPPLCLFLQVVGKKNLTLHKILESNSDANTLLVECEARELITKAERKSIAYGLRIGGSRRENEAAEDKLVDSLHKTGNEGYFRFKDILKTLSKDHIFIKHFYKDFHFEAREKKACAPKAAALVCCKDLSAIYSLVVVLL